MTPPGFDLSDPDAVSFCPSCEAGYGPRVTRCPYCEEDLVARSTIEGQLQQGAREREDQKQRDRQPLVLLCRVLDRVQVAILKQRLDETGIPYATRERDALTIPFTGLPGPVEILVAESDLNRAQWACHDLKIDDPEDS